MKSDIKQRLKEEEKQKQDKIAREAVEYANWLVKVKNTSQYRHFSYTLYPIFKPMLFDFARQIDWFIEERKPSDTTLAQFKLWYKIRGSFWQKLFPKKGGSWYFGFGSIYRKANGEATIQAIDFSPYQKENLTWSIEQIPEDVNDARVWFNDLLLRCYKFAEASRFS